MSGTDAPLSEDVPPRHWDTTKASIARVYDAALGGKDNYEVDRVVVRRLSQAAPEIGQFAWDHRNFLIRVTRFLAGEAGITQFLDCGSGLPTAENTHQTAQRIQPDARVVYVDNDPSRGRTRSRAARGEWSNPFHRCGHLHTRRDHQ